MAERNKIPLSKDGTNIIPESNSLKMYNSIVRIEYKLKEGEEIGTGFFMKIPDEKANTYFNFLVTNCHVIPESMVEKKKEIDIFYGKSKNERKRKIDLDKNKRYIKCDEERDYTVIQILNKDNILDEKYLYPEPNYKKGCEFYLNKPCYLAGYPVINKDKEGLIVEPNINKKPERCISSGKITKVHEIYKYDFEHYLETKTGSSGSPICLQGLQDNKFFVIGIHKQGGSGGNKFNYGTFIGVVIDEINKKDAIQTIISNKEKDDLVIINGEKDQENSEEYDEKILEEEEIKKESIEPKKRRLILKYIFEQKEFGKHNLITFLIFIISFTNLKLILISKRNFILTIENKYVYIFKLIGIGLVLITNHCILFLFLILQFLFFICFLKDLHQKQDLNIKILFIMRNFIKDALLIKIRKYNFYESMIFYNFAEGFSNYLAYLIILVLRMIFNQINFEISIIIIVSLLNLLNYIIFFKYNDLLKKVYKKNLNKKKNNEIENDSKENNGYCKKVFNIIGKIIFNFFVLSIVTFPSLEPSELYIGENYWKLFVFIWFDFVGRAIRKDDVNFIPTLSLKSVVINYFIPFFFYYLLKKHLIVLIIFSLCYGNICLIINYIKNEDNLIYYIIMQLLAPF